MPRLGLSSLVLLAILPVNAQAEPDPPETPKAETPTAETPKAEAAERLGPRLPIARWRTELSLSDSQAKRLIPVDDWLQLERARLRESQRGGALGFSALAERAKALKAELQTRLAQVLTLEQLEQVDLDELFPRKIPPLLFTVRGSAQTTFRSGFDEGRGDVATFGYQASVQARIALGDRVGLTLSLGGGETHFDFDDATELDPLRGDPFNRLVNGRVSLGLTWQITKRWTAFASANASAAGEQDAVFEDSITYGGAGGISYAFHKNFSLGIGFSARTRLEDDPQIIPLPIIRLRLDFTEQLRLTLGVPQGLRLTYAPLPELEFSLTGGFGGLMGIPDARLDDEGFAPEGVFRQTTIPITVVVDWRPLPILKISLEGGLIAYRKYEIDDARGHSLTEVKTDPTGYVQFSFGLTF